MKSAILGVAFLLNSISATASEDQYMIKFAIIEQGVAKYDVSRLVNKHKNSDMTGDNNHYLAVDCEQGKKFYVMPVFTGYSSNYLIKDGKVVLNVSKNGVQDVSSQVRSLPETQCQTLSPKQTVIWQKGIEIYISDLVETKEVIIDKDTKLLVKLSKDYPSNVGN